MPWLVIEDIEVLRMMHRAQSGESPDMILLEILANGIYKPADEEADGTDGD